MMMGRARASILPIDIIGVLSPSLFLPRVFARNTNPPSRNFILSLHETEALARSVSLSLSLSLSLCLEDLSVDTRQISDKSRQQPRTEWSEEARAQIAARNVI